MGKVAAIRPPTRPNNEFAAVLADLRVAYRFSPERGRARPAIVQAANRIKLLATNIPNQPIEREVTAV